MDRVSIKRISPTKVHIAEGEQVKTFFVVQVALKKKDFDERTIATISKLIPQNMLLVLEYGREARLAVYYTKLMQTKWQPKDSFSIELKGLNLDTVWENIIVQVGGVEIERGNSLAEQIVADDKRQKLQKEIVRFEKLARSEKQPKKKFEIVQQINKRKRELEGI